MFWIRRSAYDGIAAEYTSDKKLIRFDHNFENDILAAARNMAKNIKYHASHNQVLEQYAMNIFDSTRRFHGLGDENVCCFRSQLPFMPAESLSA